MYRNLKAEIVRNGLTLGQVAELMGMSVGNLSMKLAGKIETTVKEAKKLKEILKTDLPLEVLFEEAI